MAYACDVGGAHATGVQGEVVQDNAHFLGVAFDLCAVARVEPHQRSADVSLRAGIEINRKMLADLAIRDPEAFANIAEQAKGQLEAVTA